MKFSRWNVIALLALALTPCAPSPLWGQTNNAPVPVLHRRGYNQVEDEMDTRSSGRTILPLEASGEYTLGTGEFVDVELQPDRLTGYITRLGDRESDQGTPLTFFFATSRLTHLEPSQFFGMAFWIGFCINTIIVELWLRARRSA